MIYPEQSTLSLDQLIEKKCGTGKYQLTALSILVFIDLNDGCELILMSFLMPILKVEWQLTSLQVQVLTSLFYLGMVLGSLCTGVIADKKGRQKCVVFGCLVQFAVANTFLLCNSANSMGIVRFLYGFAYGFTIPLTTTMISEITSMKVRGRFLIVINFFVSVGKIYAFVLAYMCLDNFTQGHWRLMMCLSSITSLIVGVCAHLYLKESPRYLLASGQITEGLNTLEEIIHINRESPTWVGRLMDQPDCSVELVPFQGSKYGYISKSEKLAIESWIRRTFKPENKGSFKELFTKANRGTTLRLWTIWFGLNFMYFGQLIILPFILGHTQKSFWNYLQTVLGEIPSILLSMFIIEIPQLGRRNTMSLAFLIAAILHFLSYNHTWPYFFGRFFMKESWAMLYPYSTEIFQTSIRTLGFGSSAAFGRFGAALSPYVLIPLFEMEVGYPFISFGISSTMCFIACCTLPFDTVGRQLDFQNQEFEMVSKEEEAREIMSELLETKGKN